MTGRDDELGDDFFYHRGWRTLRDDLSVRLGGKTFFPGTRDEESRVLESVGEGHRVYCVEIPAGVLVAARCGDADGHAVVLTGVLEPPTH